MFTRHKKHQIIFVRTRFARDKTQSTQRLTTPFDRKFLTRYSSSLVKITIFSAFTINEVGKQTSAEILTARWYKSFFHKKFKGAYASQISLLYLKVVYGEMIDFQ